MFYNGHKLVCYAASANSAFNLKLCHMQRTLKKGSKFCDFSNTLFDQKFQFSWFRSPTEGTDNKHKKKQTNLVTYRLNRHRGQFSENKWPL